MKKTVKKLALSRETLGNLDDMEMVKALGGIVSSDNLQCMFTKKPTIQTNDTY